jgi:hypothetical protein
MSSSSFAWMIHCADATVRREMMPQSKKTQSAEALREEEEERPQRFRKSEAEGARKAGAEDLPE